MAEPAVMVGSTAAVQETFKTRKVMGDGGSRYPIYSLLDYNQFLSILMGLLASDTNTIKRDDIDCMTKKFGISFGKGIDPKRVGLHLHKLTADCRQRSDLSSINRTLEIGAASLFSSFASHFIASMSLDAVPEEHRLVMICSSALLHVNVPMLYMYTKGVDTFDEDAWRACITNYVYPSPSGINLGTISDIKINSNPLTLCEYTDASETVRAQLIGPKSTMCGHIEHCVDYHENATVPDGVVYKSFVEHYCSSVTTYTHVINTRSKTVLPHTRLSSHLGASIRGSKVLPVPSFLLAPYSFALGLCDRSIFDMLILPPRALLNTFFNNGVRLKRTEILIYQLLRGDIIYSSFSDFDELDMFLSFQRYVSPFSGEKYDLREACEDFQGPYSQIEDFVICP